MKRKLAILAVGLVVLAAATSFAVRTWVFTPSYSLRKIRMAIASNDTALFAQYASIVHAPKSEARPFSDDTTTHEFDNINRMMQKALDNPSQLSSLWEFGTYANPNSDVIQEKTSRDGDDAFVRVYFNDSRYEIPMYNEIQMQRRGWMFVAIGGNSNAANARRKLIDSAVKNFKANIKIEPEMVEILPKDLDRPPPLGNLLVFLSESTPGYGDSIRAWKREIR